MPLTRYVLAGALAAVLAVGGALGGAAVALADDAPANRGWTAPVGAADEYDERSE